MLLLRIFRGHPEGREMIGTFNGSPSGIEERIRELRWNMFILLKVDTTLVCFWETSGKALTIQKF